MLGAVSENWHGTSKNWELPVHGGPKGQTFFDTNFSMCPECIVLEAEPTGYPRAPVGKKRVWIDVRNQQRSEEHTSELQSLMRISYAVFCLKKKKITQANTP